jgi:hypothetical protein
MKKSFIVLTAIISVLWVSCLDTEEKITINPDQSGTYDINIDMSGIMSQLQALTGSSADSVMTTAAKKDTLIYFKDYVDTSTSLTAEEKTMLRDGSVSLHMDKAADEMKMSVRVPFKKLQQLPYLRQHLADALDKLKAADKLMGDAMPPGSDIMGNQNGDDAAKAINPFEEGFTFNVSGKTISNKLTNKESINSTFSSDSTLQMVKQMIPLFGDLTYKTTFVLPTAVKNYKGSNPVVSNDKKTLTFSNTLSDIFDKPENLEYNVEY